MNRSNILHGHVLDMLATLPDESVQCVVTSPPYWGLRKYQGVPDYVWGGTPDCPHEWGQINRSGMSGGTASEKVHTHGSDNFQVVAPSVSGTRHLCGAWRGQYGLEPTVSLYIQHTVEVLRAVRRVLRQDGVVFWNVADSYMGGGPHHGETNGGGNRSEIARLAVDKKPCDGLKPKDLCLIPQRVALAAQSDGWWVRSDIIWNKPNPMPESVQDRPTDAYEHILMLTKSARYYWDKEAVVEPAQDWGKRDRSQMRGGTTDPMLKHHGLEDSDFAESGRNIRNVWTFPSGSFSGAHFAVFPEELPKRCILAATSEKGCCSKCCSPWVREVKESNISRTRVTGMGMDSKEGTKGRAGEANSETIGWEPSCECNAPVKPCVVLDPFAGSGTTGIVATKLGRESILIEASDEYVKLIQDRTAQEGML